MRELISRTELTIAVIAILWFILFAIGFNKAIGNYEGISDEILYVFEIFALCVTSIFSMVFVINLVRDADYNREQEMRRQIELEKMKTRKPDDDERDWILM